MANAPSNKGHSHIKTLNRFRSFWASVSAVKFESDDVLDETVKAIIAGIESVE